MSDDFDDFIDDFTPSEVAQAEYQTFTLGPYGFLDPDPDSPFFGLANPLYYTFPILPNEQGSRLGVFPPRQTIGPPDPDADDTLSTINWMDLTGGVGNRVINPASDTNKVAWSTADIGYTDGWTNPPRAIMRKPASYSGNLTDLLRIGDTLYGLWGTSLHPWDADDHTWGAGTALGVTPVGRAVLFNGAAYFPCGSSGYVTIAESAPGTLAAPATVTGAASPSSNSPKPTSNPRPLIFGLYNENLYCITTAAEGYTLALSTTGASASWSWPFQTNRSVFVKLNSGGVPKKLVEYLNRDGEPALWCVTSRGARRFDEANILWASTNLRDMPPHPDFGRDAMVFRPGEDLWIVGGGGDMIQYTSSNVGATGQGPGGTGGGIPASKRGTIVSLSADLVNMYALMQGDVSLADSVEVVEDAPADNLYVPDAQATSSLLAYNALGWRPLWETSAVAATPTVCYVADPPNAAGFADYRVHWGIGEEAWSMPCRLTTYSAQQGREAGIDEFADSSYIEWGRFHAGSIARLKLFSHVSVILDQGSQGVEYVELEYQTDADTSGTWHQLGTAYDTTERTILPFGLSDDGLFSRGLTANWLKLRLTLHGTGGALSSPVVTAVSLAYLVIPIDAGSFIYKVILPPDTDERSGEKTRRQITSRLRAMAESREFLQLINHRGENIRVYIAGMSETNAEADDAFGSVTLNLVEVQTGLENG